MNRDQIYLSAIKDRDGSVNVGYLILFKIMRTFWVELGVMTLGATVAMYAAWIIIDEVARVDAMIKVLSAYGVAVGIVAAANFTTSLLGIGGFLWGDSHSNAATTMTHEESSTVVKQQTPAGPTIEGLK